MLWCLEALRDRIFDEYALAREEEAAAGAAGRGTGAAAADRRRHAARVRRGDAGIGIGSSTPSTTEERVEALCLILFHSLSVVPPVAIDAASELARAVIWEAMLMDRGGGVGGGGGGGEEGGGGVAVVRVSELGARMAGLLQHAVLSQENPTTRTMFAKWLLNAAARKFAPVCGGEVGAAL
jgi:hypothetical protein